MFDGGDEFDDGDDEARAGSSSSRGYGGGMGARARDGVTGEVRRRVGRRWRPRLGACGQMWWRPEVADGMWVEEEGEVEVRATGR